MDASASAQREISLPDSKNGEEKSVTVSKKDGEISGAATKVPVSAFSPKTA